MWRYRVATNYIHPRDNDKNKGASMYIEGRPKESKNVAAFINNT